MAIPALRVLHSRNCRYYFSGQGVSLVGTWMTRVATSWLVYRLTGSAALLGVVAFAGQIPTFLLSPIAGVWVDRWNRQRALVLTQVLLSLQSLTMAALTLAGRITTTEILVLSAIQGAINAFDMPARQVFLIDMIEDRTSLGNAIALNSSMVNLARLVGPSLAGVTIALVGEGYCFLIDGVSFFAVIASLLVMHVPRQEVIARDRSLLAQLHEGWRYVRRFAPVRTMLLMFAVISFMGVPYSVLMPVFAAEVLHGGPMTLGILLGANGVGALLAAIRLAVRRSIVGLYRTTAICAAIFGVALAAFAASRNMTLSVLLMIGVGYGMLQAVTAISTILQTIVPEETRGRVMSYWTMAYMGAAPFASVAAGALAGAIGARWTLASCGAGGLAGALWFWSERKTVRPLVRPIYERLGILRQGPAPEDPGN